MLPSIFLAAAENYNIKRMPSSVIPKLLQSHLKTTNPSTCHTYYSYFKILSFPWPHGTTIVICGDHGDHSEHHC